MTADGATANGAAARAARPRTGGSLRTRAAFAALAVATIAVGLAVHLRGDALGPVARDVLGDALWAAMMAWGMGALLPRRPIAARGALALAICWAVEGSQRVHTPTLDAVRATRGGHLVLGSGWDPRDLVAYAGGVLVAVALEAAWRRGRTRRGPGTG